MADDPNEDESWLYGSADDSANTASTAESSDATATATTNNKPAAADAKQTTAADDDDNFIEADSQPELSETLGAADIGANNLSQSSGRQQRDAADGNDGPDGGDERGEADGDGSDDGAGGGAAHKATKQPRNEADNDNDSFRDSDDDDADDDINVVIGVIKPDKAGGSSQGGANASGNASGGPGGSGTGGGQSYNIKQRPPLLGPGGTTAQTGDPTKPKQAPGKFSIDEFECVGTISGVPAHEFSIDSLDEKPWRKPGADITDYFNYGFNEETWRAYCERQKQMRLNESGVGLQGLSMGIPATVKNEYRERMMGERRGMMGGPGGGGGNVGATIEEFGTAAGGFRTDGGASGMAGGFIRRAGPPPGRKVRMRVWRID